MKKLKMDKAYKQSIFAILILFVVTFFFYFFLAKAMNMWNNEIAGYIFYGMFQFTIILFAFKDNLRYADRVRNLLLIYSVSLVLMGFSIKINHEYIEPILIIPVLYALYVDYKTGMVAGILSISLKYLFNMDISEIYIIYYIMCICSCVFIPYINDYKIMVISSIAYIIVSLLATVLVEFIFNEQIFAWVIINVMVNVVINIILIIASKVIYVYNSSSKRLIRHLNKLLDNNNELLVALKNYSIPSYLHGEEVATLAQGASKLIGADALLTRCAGMYHEIGRINGKKDIANETLKIAIDNNFPKPLIDILNEYSIKTGRPNSKEAALVMISDTVITTIEYMNHNKKSFTYDKLIDNIFAQRLAKGYFDNSELTIAEYHIVKEYFITNFLKK